MSDLEMILRFLGALLIAGASVGYGIAYRNWFRLDYDDTPLERVPETEQIPATPIDITPLKPRLERMREDYVAELHPLASTMESRKDRVAHTRQSLGQLAFFRERVVEREEDGRPANQ